MLPQIICSVISRCYQKIFFSLGKMLLHLYIDTLYKSSFAHRFYNPGSSQNGDSSHNSQTWIKGFLCNFHTFRNGDDDFQTTLIIIFLSNFCGFTQNHGLWHRIDGCFPDFLGKSGFCYPSHTNASVEDDSRFFCFLHRGINQYSVCSIRIISCILLNCTSHLISFNLDVFQFQCKQDSLRSHQGDSLLHDTTQQDLCSTLTCSCCAGACCIAKPHFFIATYHVVIFQSVFHDASFAALLSHSVCRLLYSIAIHKKEGFLCATKSLLKVLFPKYPLVAADHISSLQ